MTQPEAPAEPDAPTEPDASLEPTHSALDEAYLTTSGFGGWSPAALAAVNDVGIHLRTWGDGYGYAMVATGVADAMVDPVVAEWDVAPMSVILTEAGGRFTALDGHEGADRGHGLATNGLLHDPLVELLHI